eukprot:CAMPEP_0117696656 /NCGR_PEP_ID=MMETSP0804-20121206/28794_1 /TAXON_ID=1074897 /ORGANISM="Tetraselmis astigmatica, Strain CCMP880" /LENGTH=827 /DNA_ID=CAMNT_0005510819 /DNA_START=522 /DNA_END=3005 /DNA_ORIENTATION=+
MGEETSAAAKGSVAGDESSAYLLILELIIESQISQTSTLDATDELFSPEIVDLDDESAVAPAEGLKEPVLFYAQGGEPGSGHCFFLDNCTNEELTAVRLVVPDVPGILTAATTAIEMEGMDIVHCQMEQLEGLRAGWAYIECYILSDEGERVEGRETAKRLCQQLRSKLGERLKIARRRSHYRPHHFRRSSISVRNRQKAEAKAQAEGQPQHGRGERAAGAEVAVSAPSLESPFLSSGSVGGISSLSLPSAFADEYHRSHSSSASSYSAAQRETASFETHEASVSGEGEGAGGVGRLSSATLMARSVSDLMTRQIEVVPEEMPVQEAFKLMSAKQRSCLVVDNGAGREPGIVTKRDFLTKKVADQPGPTIGDLQTQPIAFVQSTDLLTMAFELMSKLGVKRLLVKAPDTGDEPENAIQQYIGEISEESLVDAAVFPAPSSGDPQIAGASASSTAEAPAGRLKAFASWEINFSEITLISRVGQGSFGEVWHGRWNGTDVAVKRVWGLMESIEEAVNAARDFDREISLLSRIRHPNVVMFLGACSVAPDVALVMEYCPRGTLYRLLHRTTTPLPLPLRVRMATHVARGMLALHSARPRVIHRDLKSANLLVSSSYEIKVCDFGLSRTMENAAACLSNRSQSSFGTVEYAAPEVLRGEPYSEKCDIWSFGVVLWELLMRQRPYSNAGHSVSVIAGVSLGRLSLAPLPDGVATPVLQELICQCCQQDPGRRPSFAEILMTMEQETSCLRQPPVAPVATSAPASRGKPPSSGAAPWAGTLKGVQGPELGAEVASPFADALDSPFAQMMVSSQPAPDRNGNTTAAWTGSEGLQ